ncbi:two-component sensor histidine kinase [Ammoniphilus oxalaticus]|uniref:Heme sensor protein HssS n=1 Tax=Ammoniphilus oxalaticus TaxID=66863 RepID=A0A419SGN1_9BACL|nr:HAMP domain-containing sensor histidine kinase [Ammoniphilus oxalaticus]RKD22954.1 two-component sensor histidine kinase [Ammoniphilus oxalaticus]
MRSLYGKFMIVTFGIMIASGLLSFMLANAYYQHQLKPENDQKNTELALQVVSFIEQNPDLDLEAYLHSLAAVGYQLHLVQESGDSLFFGGPFRDKSLPVSIEKRVLNGDIYHGILHFPQETFVTGFFANELRNTIGVPLTFHGQQYALFLRPSIEFLFREMRSLFGLLIIFSTTLSILMVVISAKFLVNPIAKLTKATTHLSRGDFQVELDIARQDELGELAQSFLRMANKLEQIEDMRKEFISNISHDIQSPLSNIKGYVNLLEKETVVGKERSQYVAITNAEIQRLSTLTKQLLLLASLDRNEDILRKTHFNVSDQWKELIRSYQWLISEKGIMLSYSLPDTEIYGDPSLLNTVWDNLLTNAIKYNQADGSMDVSIHKTATTVSIKVEDTGIGLSQTELERIFERFYRADSSRTRTMEGTGLGLSIVATIVQLHNGQIQVTSKEKEGTTFIVELPIEPKEDLQHI